MSAVDNLGAHLLGRKQGLVHDERDWPLEAILAGAITPLDATAAALARSTCHPAVKAYVKVLNPLIEELLGPAPVPTPAPPSGAVSWTDAEVVLDQGQTPHCVGFGGAQWGNTLPVDDQFANADGDALYYECKVLDGEPGAEDGSSVHSLAKALKNRGRLAAYAWASTIDAVVAWLQQHGPVILGTDWYDGMFTPDADGTVHPTGGVAGGHCYVATGYDPAQHRIQCLNSWSSNWGAGGYFWLSAGDAAMLLGSSGAEACAAIELP